jgi:hypothetical protein
MSSHPTMADLTDGTRIYHAKWDATGTIRQVGGDFEIRWDGCLVADQISDEGIVFPADVEILEAAR